MAGKGTSGEEWAAYKSRISAVGLLIDRDYQPPLREYLVETDNEIPQNLQNLEKNTFLQLILGKQSMSYFYTFVEDWYNQGGRELSERVQAAYEEQ